MTCSGFLVKGEGTKIPSCRDPEVAAVGKALQVVLVGPDLLGAHAARLAKRLGGQVAAPVAEEAPAAAAGHVHFAPGTSAKCTNCGTVGACG